MTVSLLEECLEWKLFSHHCIIHKEALCAEDIDFNHVISPVVLIQFDLAHSTEENLGNFSKKKPMNMVNFYFTTQSDGFPREKRFHVSSN
jgi:hypothetical protein